jgi:crotonobetainyl-CoA:carnitine CoA-transferase CaiB-like acyl-CoA transferase
VIDLGRFVAGPFCGVLLADMGAEVVKIEIPGHGDEIRHHGVHVNGESAYFVGLNRSKQSLTLDLKSEEGKEVFRRLVREADVVIENFRPDVMRKLGLHYEALRAMKPGIIYCAISGFGKDGPYALRPSFDFIAQGMSGLMSINGFPDGDPVRIGIPLSDSVAALYAAYGITLALLARRRTGQGQEVQVSLVDGMISLLSFQADKYFGAGEVPRRAGNDHPVSSPYGTFRARDGHINVAPPGDDMWARFATALGRPDLVRDPRFLTNELRCQHRQEINRIINTITATRTMAEWVEHFNAAGVPCGPIHDLAQVFADPQVGHQQMVLELEQPSGKVKTLGFPLKLSATPAALHGPSPQLGQHTEEILQRLGYTAAEMDRLKAKKVV